jgi:predicted dehydrogenase
MKVAILGTGFWATYAHLPALRALPGVEVTSCIGRTLDRARAFAEHEGIPSVYGSVEELFASRDRPEMLVVAAPDTVHPAATTAALEAGVPVFCEKPLANEAAVAHQLADLATRSGIAATVGYSFRYSPAVQALRMDVRDGRLGTPWLLELFEYNAQFHPRNGKPMNWKGDPAMAAAGALFEYGSHVVDIAGWLAGPIEAVSTNLTSVLPGARLDDIATLQMRLRSPAIGVLVASWVLTGTIPGIRIRLHGSEGLGEVELNETLPSEQAYRRFNLNGSLAEDVPLEPLGSAGSAYARRHLADFIARIRGDEPLFDSTLPSLDDGAHAQDVLEAALGATEHWASIPQP